MLIAELFATIGLTGATQFNAQVKRSTDSLSDLNRMRREGARWQRLASYTDAGALETLSRLQAMYGRVVGSSEGFNKALEMQVKRQVVGVASAAGYTKAQRDFLYATARVDVGLANFQKKLERVQTTMKPLTDAMKWAQIGILGFVTAGMAGTTEGAALQVRLRALSMEIAGIFKPVIDAIIGKLDDLVTWFRKLTPQEEKQLRFWALFTAGALMAIPVIMRVIGAIRSLIAVMQLLGLSALTSGFMAMGAALLALIPIYAMFYAAQRRSVKAKADELEELVASVKMTDQAKDNLKEYIDQANKFERLGMHDEAKDILDKAIRQLRAQGAVTRDEKRQAELTRNRMTLQGGAFEGIADTWRRIQATANRTDFDKQTANNTKRAADALEEMRDRRAGPTPPMGMT